jgi:HK97 family phage portal protein
MGLFSWASGKGWDVPTEKRETLPASAWDTLSSSSSSGVSVNKQTALTLSAVYASVKVITDAFSSLPIHVIKENGRNKEIDTSNPIDFLLHKEPNEIHTSYVWRQIIMPHLLLWGNSYCLIEFQGGGSRRPKALLPVHPSKVQVDLVDGKLIYTVQLEKTKIVVDQAQMLHVRGLGDEIEGKSVIDVAASNLGLGKAAEDFGSGFFERGASSSGVLSTEQTLSDKAIKNLRDSHNNTYSGVNNSNKTMILEQGLKYQQTSIPPDNAQFLETRQFNVTDVARWFSVPPHKLAELTNATFSNIEEQELNFVKHTIAAYVINHEQEWDKKLFRDSEKSNTYTKMNLEGLLRGDIKTRYDAYKIGIQNGFITPNEAREKENMNPLDGLDHTWMQTNTAPVIDGTNQQSNGETNN